MPALIDLTDSQRKRGYLDAPAAAQVRAGDRIGFIRSVTGNVTEIGNPQRYISSSRKDKHTEPDFSKLGSWGGGPQAKSLEHIFSRLKQIQEPAHTPPPIPTAERPSYAHITITTCAVLLNATLLISAAAIGHVSPRAGTRQLVGDVWQQDEYVLSPVPTGEEQDALSGLTHRNDGSLSEALLDTPAQDQLQHVEPIEKLQMPNRELELVSEPKAIAHKTEEVNRQVVPPALPGSSTDTIRFESVHLRGPAALIEGHRLFLAGDIVSARRLFERSAKEGLPSAAFAMGMTYDPKTLAARGMPHFTASSEKAVFWYKRAHVLAAGQHNAPTWERAAAIANPQPSASP